MAPAKRQVSCCPVHQAGIDERAAKSTCHRLADGRLAGASRTIYGNLQVEITSCVWQIFGGPLHVYPLQGVLAADEVPDTQTPSHSSIVVFVTDDGGKTWEPLQLK